MAPLHKGIKAMKATMRALVILSLIALFAYTLYWGALYTLNRVATTPKRLQESVIFTVPKGITLAEFAHRAEAMDLVENKDIFHLWVRFFSDYSKYQAGKYLFEKEVSFEQLAEKITLGEIHQPVVYTLTVPEGFTATQIAQRIESQLPGVGKEFEKLIVKKSIIQKLRIESDSLEGYLYPATYSFVVEPSALELVTQMVRTFWRELPKNYESQVKEMGLKSLHQGVIFASLIERESSLAEEKPAISEVIWSRLRKKVALAIDASIIYGIENFDGNLRRHDLKDTANPYNTRVHRGLPPGPICSPSKSSLQAILEPTDEGYFYYVLEDKETGRHHFSKTLKEHNTYVRKFLRKGG